METPKFYNKPNPHLEYSYTNPSGISTHHDFWISRAPAVVGMIFMICPEGLRILIIKRSDIMDEPNKYAAPTGYLDWNETGFEGVTREIFEETSFYLPEYQKFCIFDNNKEPFFTQTDYKVDKKQNVSIYYILTYDFSKDENAIPNFIEKFRCNETAEVKLMKITDFFNNNLEWAFHHDDRIKQALEFFKKNYKIEKSTS
jgi:ADP-ribose pyrophosphatase YjhB (NUDIX family)